MYLCFRVAAVFLFLFSEGVLVRVGQLCDIVAWEREEVGVSVALRCVGRCEISGEKLVFLLVPWSTGIVFLEFFWIFFGIFLEFSRISFFFGVFPGIFLFRSSCTIVDLWACAVRWGSDIFIIFGKMLMLYRS